MTRYRVCFAKGGDLRFISHLDLQRTVVRALNRAALPVVYSQGFNPQPRLVFAAPLALGIAGEKEYFELDLAAPLAPARLQERLQARFPPGLQVKSVREVDAREPSLASRVVAARYRVDLPQVPPDLEARTARLVRRESLPVSRPGKKGIKKVDIRPFIFQVVLDTIEQGAGRLTLLLATGHQGGARPAEVLQELDLAELDPPPRISRSELLVSAGDQLVPLDA